jgi:uncharacterized membrane protein YfcA
MLITLIGFFAGIVGGMGIGGGTILIPSLVFFIGTKQQIAQSVNLISFVPTAIVAILVHLKHKNIEVKIILKLILLGCIGAVAGSALAVNLDSNILKKAFGIFLFIMGVYEITSKKGKKKKGVKDEN